MLRRSIDVTVDGMEEFKTANMYVNCHQIEGSVLKRIVNRKLYHSKPFHKKFMRIVYCAEQISIYDDREQPPSRAIPLQSLLEVTEVPAVEGCPWKFAFAMKTLEGTLHLHCATHEEHGHWLKTLNLLLAMRA
jgi:hypothetical protein